jgi:hypothetical protein
MSSVDHRLGFAIALVVCSAAVAQDARAQGESAGSYPQVWLNPGVYSRHFDRGRDLREANVGIGAELLLADEHLVHAGSFINSDRRRSRYAAYQWRPLHPEVLGLRVNLGVSIGAFDGYPRYRDGAWFPAALPVASVEGRRLGVNVFLVPTIRDRLHGAVAVQFKVRLW